MRRTAIRHPAYATAAPRAPDGDCDPVPLDVESNRTHRHDPSDCRPSPAGNACAPASTCVRPCVVDTVPAPSIAAQRHRSAAATSLRAAGCMSPSGVDPRRRDPRPRFDARTFAADAAEGVAAFACGRAGTRGKRLRETVRDTAGRARLKWMRTRGRGRKAKRPRRASEGVRVPRRSGCRSPWWKISVGGCGRSRRDRSNRRRYLHDRARARTDVRRREAAQATSKCVWTGRASSEGSVGSNGAEGLKFRVFTQRVLRWARKLHPSFTKCKHFFRRPTSGSAVDARRLRRSPHSIGASDCGDVPPLAQAADAMRSRMDVRVRGGRMRVPRRRMGRVGAARIHVLHVRMLHARMLRARARRIRFRGSGFLRWRAFRPRSAFRRHRSSRASARIRFESGTVRGQRAMSACS